MMFVVLQSILDRAMPGVGTDHLFAEAQLTLIDGDPVFEGIHGALDVKTTHLETALEGFALFGVDLKAARTLLSRTTQRAKSVGDRRLSGYMELFNALSEAESVSTEQTIAALRSATVRLEPFPSTHLLGRASLAVMLARCGELSEAMEITRSGLATLRHSTHFLDDELLTWSNFVEVLELGGAHEQADLANAEALCRVDRLASEIQDESIRQSLLAYEPVVRLVQRAHRREFGDVDDHDEHDDHQVTT
jgi:hypothetical protein